MKRHFESPILALFLTLAVGLSLPVPVLGADRGPAHALRPGSALENSVHVGLEEAMQEGQPTPAAGLEEWKGKARTLSVMHELLQYIGMATAQKSLTLLLLDVRNGAKSRMVASQLEKFLRDWVDYVYVLSGERVEADIGEQELSKKVAGVISIEVPMMVLARFDNSQLPPPTTQGEFSQFFDDWVFSASVQNTKMGGTLEHFPVGAARITWCRS